MVALTDDFTNRRIAAYPGDEIATSSAYAGGRRIRKIVTNGGVPNDSALNGTTDYLYHSGAAQCVEERDDVNTPAKQYIWGIYIDELIQMRTF